MFSAVIITYNEERNIGRCLDSLQGVADEIVVLDSFSNDRTAEICREKGVHFFQHAFDGHIEQKNRALELAQNDWILSLDADEALDETLRQSMLQVKNNPTGDAYSMNRLTNYCGRWIRHSGWYPDRKIRLFDRRKARWGGVNPHDKIITAPDSRAQQLRGDLLHYSYYSVEEHRLRARKYAEIAALAMHQKGRRGAWLRMVFSPLVKFIRNYFFKRGFLDGRAGWTICSIAAWETHWKYRLLAQLNRRRRNSKIP